MHEDRTVDSPRPRFVSVSVPEGSRPRSQYTHPKNVPGSQDPRNQNTRLPYWLHWPDRALASASPVPQSQDSEPVASPSRPSALVLDVLPNDVARRPTTGCGEVRGGPEVVSVSADPVLRPEPPEETPFNEFTSLESCTVGGYSTQIWTKNMDVVVLPVHLRQGCTEVLAHVSAHGS